MPDIEYDGLSAYRKVAPRRLLDAEELLETPSLAPHESDASTRHLRGAMYLGGYAVECILKAYIIAQEPRCQTLTDAAETRRERGENVPNLLGKPGHSLQTLISIAGLERFLDTDPALKQEWSICARWNSNWRYNPTVPRPEDATEFLRAVRRVYHWVDARL